MPLHRDVFTIDGNLNIVAWFYSNSTKDCDCTLSDFAAADRKIRFYFLPFFCGNAVVDRLADGFLSYALLLQSFLALALLHLSTPEDKNIR